MFGMNPQAWLVEHARSHRALVEAAMPSAAAPRITAPQAAARTAGVGATAVCCTP